MMFKELKGELKALRDDVNSIKKAEQSEISEIKSLFSSLESTHGVSPLVQYQQQPAMLSPPPASATAPMFRPRANSLPPICMEPYLDGGSPSLILPTSAARAQQMRITLQPIPQRSPASHQQPHPSTSGGPSFSAPIASAHQPLSADLSVGVSSPPLLSPSSHSQSSFNVGSQLPPVQASSQNQVRAPLPIPSYMPLKSAECVIKMYPQYLNEKNIGRLANKLARFTYFGETVLAQSSLSGGTDEPPQPKHINANEAKRVTNRV